MGCVWTWLLASQPSDVSAWSEQPERGLGTVKCFLKHEEKDESCFTLSILYCNSRSVDVCPWHILQVSCTCSYSNSRQLLWYKNVSSHKRKFIYMCIKKTVIHWYHKVPHLTTNHKLPQSTIPSRLAFLGAWVSSVCTAGTGTTDCHKVPYLLG